ncbi:TetR/AcrR family transcriptional regulator [Lawsonella clevelandensis]|nr:TetR/AcrR family transcriptional regulator [Lawsonella clevelandensis]MDU7193678.1 TetR/AcrR family transcriptional regulator [Lawsonella clevelandensis]VHO01661.1 Tetracycline repressor protein class A from transposon 1721 [Lawsonella clevelandensis]
MSQLSRDLIVHAAIDILQTYGLQDLSIRKVARQLGVQPGALYWYFPNKQALLGAVCSYILSCDSPSLEPPLPAIHLTTSSAWAQHVATVAEDLRTRALSFRDGSELLSAALAAQTAHFPQLDLLTSYVSEVSSTPQVHARALLLFILGALVDEQTRRQLAELADTDTSTDASADILSAGLSAITAGLTV